MEVLIDITDDGYWWGERKIQADQRMSNNSEGKLGVLWWKWCQWVNVN